MAGLMGGKNKPPKKIKEIKVTKEKAPKIKNSSSNENSIAFKDILRWLGIILIVIGFGYGLLFSTLSLWVSPFILAIGVGLIIASHKLLEMKSSFTASNQSLNIAIGSYIVSALLVFILFFHGAEIEIFKKSNIREITTQKLAIVNNLVSQYKINKEAKYKAYEQRLNAHIDNYGRGDNTALDSIVELSAQINIESSLVREYQFQRTGDANAFKDKFHYNYTNLFKEIDEVVVDFEYFSSTVKSDTKGLFVLLAIKIPDINNEIDDFESVLYPIINEKFSNIEEAEYIENYPFSNPFASFSEASIGQILIILALYLALNGLILLEFFATSGSYRGSTKFQPKQRR